MHACLHAKSLQSCPTLYDPMDCYPASLLCPWDSLGRNTGVGCHAFLQGSFLTQESNSDLQRCRHILYHRATREAVIMFIDQHLLCVMYFPTVCDV